MVTALARCGMRVAGGNASMYLWVAIPAGERSEELAARLLEHGILVAPGSYLGAAGEGYVRIALVPTLAECQRAAALLEDAL
jgi:aspartate/methionine/tyrosine aminotransferase